MFLILNNSLLDVLGYQYLVENPSLAKRSSHSRDSIKDFVIDLNNKQDTKDKLAYLLDIGFTSTTGGGRDYLSVILDFDTPLHFDESSRIVSVDEAIGIISSQGFVPIDHLDSGNPQSHDLRNRYDSAGYHNFAFKIDNPQGVIEISGFNLKWNQIWEVYCYYPVSSYIALLDAHIKSLKL